MLGLAQDSGLVAEEALVLDSGWAMDLDWVMGSELALDYPQNQGYSLSQDHLPIQGAKAFPLYHLLG